MSDNTAGVLPAGAQIADLVAVDNYSEKAVDVDIEKAAGVVVVVGNEIVVEKLGALPTAARFALAQRSQEARAAHTRAGALFA